MRNRWLILAAGIVIQTILGGIYAWSVFAESLAENYGISRGQSGSIFGISIAVFTLAMILGGRVLSAKGPRFTALIGALLFAAGYLLASVSGGSYALLVLSIGGLSGAGIGFGYVCPLTVGMQWFPKRKGMITGIAVAGFGGGAVILSSVANHFIGGRMDVLTFFRWIGIVPGGLLILSALVLAVPEADTNAGGSGFHSGSGNIFKWPFLICWLGIFIGTFAGLLIVGNLAPIAETYDLYEWGGRAIAIFAAGNALGRILWGILFDKINYKTIPASLACFAIALVVLRFAVNPWWFLLTSGLLGFGFGSNFVIYASSLSRHFGVMEFPKLYPICFLGYGLAGITGPAIGGSLADYTESYYPAIYISIALLVSAAIITTAGLGTFKQTA